MNKIFSYISNQFDLEYHHLNLWYLVAFILGIITYFNMSYEPNIKYVMSLFLSSLSLLYLRKYGLIGIFISSFVIFFLLGIVVSKYQTLSINARSINKAFSTIIEGKVSSFKPITNGEQIILSDVFLVKEKRKFPSNIRLNSKEEYCKDFMVGDKIQVFTFLTPSPLSVLPGGYDFELYNYFSSIGAIGYSLEEPKIIEKTEIGNIKSYIQKIRKIIYRRLVSVIGKEEGNFAAAILLGESKGLDKNIMQNMRFAGISHILCVSGLHLSLVAGLFFLSSRFLLNLSNNIAFNYDIKSISAIISLIGSFLYLMISGMQIAATRAFIMTSIFILSVIIGRSPYPLRSISIAAFIILLMNPEYALHPSFQLSFIAVLSLVTGFEFYMKNRYLLGNSKGIFAIIKLYFCANIYSSLLAGFATTPVVIYHFYIASNYSVISNLLAVPIMSFFMMPLAILAIIFMPLHMDYYILKILGYFIGIIINFSDFITHIPGSNWYFGYITPSSILIYILGLFWITLWQKKWRHFGWVIILFSIILMFLAPKPDVIFDPLHNIVGIKNQNGNLEISGKHISKFTSNYWSNWFGQKDVLIHKYDISENNLNITTASGNKINILFKELDCNADVVINNNGFKKCSNAISMNKKEIKNTGTILVFCNKNGCKLSYNNNKRFKF